MHSVYNYISRVSGKGFKMTYFRSSRENARKDAFKALF